MSSDLPVITLLAAFASGAPYAYYDVSTYDDGSEYAPAFWTHDISTFGRDAWSVRRGMSQTNLSLGLVGDAGVFNIVLDNADRRFDPAYAAGPYSEAGFTKVVPGVPIILQATWGGVTYPVFWGTADDWPQAFPMKGKDQTINLTATDATSFFTNALLDVNVTDAKVTASCPLELSGDRISTIANLVEFPYGRNIAEGAVTVPALTDPKATAWAAMQDAANAEAGNLYIARDGLLTFRGFNDWMYTDPGSFPLTPPVFGNGPGELDVFDVTLAAPGAEIVNDCTITWATRSSASVNWQDIASQRQAWGKRSLKVTIPMQDAAAASVRADYIVQWYAWPVDTFSSITIMPKRDPVNLWPQALGRELGDRITVKLTPLGGGPRLIRDCYIQGITHTFANHQWTTKFDLSRTHA